MIKKENVTQLINEYYDKENAPIEALLKQVANEMPKETIDLQKVLEDTTQNRKALAKNIKSYEAQLVEIVDLSSVLASDHHNLTGELYMAYIVYLLQSINETIPDILELIQLLK